MSGPTGLHNAWPNGVPIILKNPQDQSYHLLPFYEEVHVKGLRKLLKTTQLESGKTSPETQVHLTPQAMVSPLGDSNSEA